MPDSNGTVLTSSPGTGISRATAARLSDGSAVLVFTAVSRTLTIDMTKLAGPSCRCSLVQSRHGRLHNRQRFPVREQR